MAFLTLWVLSGLVAVLMGCIWAIMYADDIIISICKMLQRMLKICETEAHYLG